MENYTTVQFPDHPWLSSPSGPPIIPPTPHEYRMRRRARSAPYPYPYIYDGGWRTIMRTVSTPRDRRSPAPEIVTPPSFVRSAAVSPDSVMGEMPDLRTWMAGETPMRLGWDYRPPDIEMGMEGFGGFMDSEVDAEGESECEQDLYGVVLTNGIGRREEWERGGGEMFPDVGEMGEGDVYMFEPADGSWRGVDGANDRDMDVDLQLDFVMDGEDDMPLEVFMLEFDMSGEEHAEMLRTGVYPDWVVQRARERGLERWFERRD